MCPLQVVNADFGRLGIEDQITLLRQADVLASYHGAGLTLSLFMRREAALVEIQGSGGFRCRCAGVVHALHGGQAWEGWYAGWGAGGEGQIYEGMMCRVGAGSVRWVGWEPRLARMQDRENIMLLCVVGPRRLGVRSLEAPLPCQSVPPPAEGGGACMHCAHAGMRAATACQHSLRGMPSNDLRWREQWLPDD